MLQKLFRYLLFLTFIGLLGSCANVDQIDRGLISSRLMQLDPVPEESYFIEEIKSYREGAAGGSKAVGGGCGCN